MVRCLLLCVCVLCCVLFFFLCFVFFLMIRRPPRSTLDRSSAASDVYKRQQHDLARRLAEMDGNNKANQVLTTQVQETMRELSVKVGVLDAHSAVSYTHLRAHETVLDLVCRLLLEKKNK